MTTPGLDIVVAIPARDEEALLGRAVAAIERQLGLGTQRVGLFVLANNCSDGTAAHAQSLAAGSKIPILCRSVTLGPGRAHAGWARRLAMEGAAAMAADDAVLVSTDADAVADQDWLAAVLSALAGADAVAGRVSGDWAEMQRLLPAEALTIGEREWRYQAVAAELEWLIDPVAHDPWPRHRQESGANIAVHRSCWQAVGGVPPLPCGEDRAVLAAISRAGGRVRHSNAPHVTVSARLDGRASGGMSTAMAGRAAGHVAVDTNILAADRLLDRLRGRALLRHAHAEQRIDTALAALGVAQLETDSMAPFEAIWAEIEDRVPRWQASPVAPHMLEIELAKLERHLDGARAQARTGQAVDA